MGLLKSTPAVQKAIRVDCDWARKMHTDAPPTSLTTMTHPQTHTGGYNGSHGSAGARKASRKVGEPAA